MSFKIICQSCQQEAEIIKSPQNEITLNDDTISIYVAEEAITLIICENCENRLNVHDDPIETEILPPVSKEVLEQFGYDAIGLLDHQRMLGVAQKLDQELIDYLSLSDAKLNYQQPNVYAVLYIENKRKKTNTFSGFICLTPREMANQYETLVTKEKSYFGAELKISPILGALEEVDKFVIQLDENKVSSNLNALSLNKHYQQEKADQMALTKNEQYEEALKHAKERTKSENAPHNGRRHYN